MPQNTFNGRVASYILLWLFHAGSVICLRTFFTSFQNIFFNILKYFLQYFKSTGVQ